MCIKSALTLPRKFNTKLKSTLIAETKTNIKLKSSILYKVTETVRVKANILRLVEGYQMGIFANSYSKDMRKVLSKQHKNKKIKELLLRKLKEIWDNENGE